jgi:Concanavalin A-like lectin/glucanases superfamily
MRLDDTSATAAAAQAGTATTGTATSGTATAATAATPAYEAGTALGVPGPLVGDPDTAVALNSTSAQIQTSQPYAATDQYTVEAWFKAQGGLGGGQIVGMNASQNGSNLVDDHSTYVDAAGHVDCYFYSSGWHRLVSPGTYADGNWHLVQCAKGATGMTLDIDGRLVASNTFTGPTLAYDGYWLIGYRRAGDGPKQSIVGDVAQVAIYGYALSQAQDANHWAVGQGQATPGS